MTDNDIIAVKVIKEGFLRKRSGRLHQWSHRYFILSQYQTSAMSKPGCKISYKVKADSPSHKASFELLPGCVVTDVQSIGVNVGTTSKLSKKMYTFWLVWPTDKNSSKLIDGDDRIDDSLSQHNSYHNSNLEIQFRPSDGENDSAGEEDKTGIRRDGNTKDFKHILAQQEMENQKILQSRTKAEEQVASHQAHDNNVSLGVKIAAVAAGGAVVGGLTFGMGLIPYAIAVGLTAVAGGSVASTMQWKRPSDSRLIMACETMADAMEWKAAIESEICRLEEVQQPMLPSFVDLHAISSIINKSNISSSYEESRTATEGQWRKARSVENIRIMEYYSQVDFLNPIEFVRLKSDRLLSLGDASWRKSLSVASRTFLYRSPALRSSNTSLGSFWDPNSTNNGLCRKAQTIISGVQPVEAFLLLMQSKLWPKGGSVKIVKEVDDHADIVEVSWKSKAGTARSLLFSRFWKVDDDGIYLVTFNVIKPEDQRDLSSASSDSSHSMSRSPSLPSTANNSLLVDAVISITPRGTTGKANHRGVSSESLVTCICQVSPSPTALSVKGDSGWTKSEILRLTDSFLHEHLIGLQNGILMERFGLANCFLESSKSVDSKQARDAASDATSVPAPAETTPSSGPSLSSGSAPSSAAKKERPPLFRRSSYGDVKKQSGFGRRGVTTVQPGLEDSTATSFNENAAQIAAVNGIDGGTSETSLGSDARVFPPSKAAAALILNNEDSYPSRQTSVTESTTTHTTDSEAGAGGRKKNLKLFSLHSKWSADSRTQPRPEDPSLAPRASFSRSQSMYVGSGDRKQKSNWFSSSSHGERRDGRQPVSQELAKLQSQIASKESDLAALEQKIQKKNTLSASKQPNQSSYNFFSKAAPRNTFEEDLASLLSQHNEIRSQLNSLVDTYKAIAGENKKQEEEAQNNVRSRALSLVQLPDGTLISDLGVPPHWVQPVVRNQVTEATSVADSLISLYDAIGKQVDKSCDLLLDDNKNSFQKLDGIVANFIIILTLIALFSNIALVEYLLY